MQVRDYMKGLEKPENAVKGKLYWILFPYINNQQDLDEFKNREGELYFSLYIGKNKGKVSAAFCEACTSLGAESRFISPRNDYFIVFLKKTVMDNLEKNAEEIICALESSAVLKKDVNKYFNEWNVKALNKAKFTPTPY